jgi:L-iditol 2-dehydrogenase
MGAETVIDVSREDLARRTRELTGGEGAHRVIVGPGTPQAMLDGIKACAPGGTVLFFTPAPPGRLLEIEQHYLYFNEISLACSYSCGPYDTREALSLIVRGVIRADDFVTHRFPLAAAADAFRLTAAGGDSLKALVKLTDET